MKRRHIVSLAAALWCYSMVSFVQAQTVTGTFSGLNEVPANASLGTGFASVTINLATHTLTVQANFSNLTGTVTAAHVHAPGGPGVSAGVATQTPSFVGFPLGVTNGSYSMSFDTLMASTWNPAYISANGGTPAGAEMAFASALNSGQTYFNIHTNSFPGGEIRANLIPEPSVVLLLGVGAAGAGVAAWRRRRAWVGPS